LKNNFHISFDLDGTLIDSFPLMKSSWENVNKNLNLKIGWERYRKNIGLDFDEICENLDLNNEKMRIKRMYFDYNKENVDKIKLFSGVRELIKEIEKNEISWSIITSKPQYTAKDIIDLFELKPEYLICCDDVSKGKPNNESSVLLKRFYKNKKFRDYYYVGDSIADHIFAINSGFKFIQFYNNDKASDQTDEEENNIINNSLILNPRPIVNHMSNILSYLY